MTDKILLVQFDGTMPNLVLMELSAYYKEQGCEVGFNVGDPDKVFISCIFDWNKSIVRGVPKLFDCIVELGGSGVNIEKKLPDEIEHIMPDYSLYDIDYSMGFTSRGCPNNCPFCIVPAKEGGIREHSPIEEFLHPDHMKIILLDNNFLASPKWKEKLQYLIDEGLMVNFCQGNDIRLIDEEKAKMLSELNFYNHNFTYKHLHFAWDHMGIEGKVKRGIRILKDAGIKPYRLMFYMLCGFNTTFEQDMYRFQKLREWGVDPFVMIYNNEGNEILRHFARWVNKRVYKSCKWRDYDRLSIQQKKNGEYGPR